MKEKYMAPVVVSMKELDKSIGKGKLPNSNNGRRNNFGSKPSRSYS